MTFRKLNPDERRRSQEREQTSASYLLFSVGSAHYAVPLLMVREVVARPETTPVPYASPHFLGITNLRGQVVSILDLGLKLGVQRAKNGDEEVAIVTEFGGYVVGWVVDAVIAVVPLEQRDISEPPRLEADRETGFITGIARRNEELILIIDIRKVLGVEDLDVLASRTESDEAA